MYKSITLFEKLYLNGMQICRKEVFNFLNFLNLFLFINFGLMSYPTVDPAFEISFKIGEPISPNPTTMLFFVNLSLIKVIIVLINNLFFFVMVFPEND